MAGISPTQRTIAYLKDQGLICGIVERLIPNPKHPGGGFTIRTYLNIIDINSQSVKKKVLLGIKYVVQIMLRTHEKDHGRKGR